MTPMWINDFLSKILHVVDRCWEHTRLIVNWTFKFSEFEYVLRQLSQQTTFSINLSRKFNQNICSFVVSFSQKSKHTILSCMFLSVILFCFYFYIFTQHTKKFESFYYVEALRYIDVTWEQSSKQWFHIFILAHGLYLNCDTGRFIYLGLCDLDECTCLI